MGKNVEYKGILLSQNSYSYELYQEAQKDPKIWAKLDQHLKSLETKNQDLIKRYEPKEVKNG